MIPMDVGGNLLENQILNGVQLNSRGIQQVDADVLKAACSTDQLVSNTGYHTNGKIDDTPII